MGHKRWAAVVLAAVVAAGCSGQKKAAPPSDAAALPEVAPARQAAFVATEAGAAPGAAQASGLQAMAASRKLIRTGQVALVVKDYGHAAGEVKRIAESFGGYLAEAQAQRGAQDRRHGSLTIRVDAARFDDAVAALRALGDVRSESVGTQDVTKAYTDLETRLRVKRDTAERLREILRTRTAKLSDVLEAERELARVTEEIEQMEGERRFYDQQIALSTLTVALQEPSAIVEAGVLSPISDAIRESLGVLAESIAALIYATVFLAPWVLLLWIAWRLFKRARARRKAAAAAVS